MTALTVYLKQPGMVKLHEITTSTIHASKHKILFFKVPNIARNGPNQQIPTACLKFEFHISSRRKTLTAGVVAELPREDFQAIQAGDLGRGQFPSETPTSTIQLWERLSSLD